MKTIFTKISLLALLCCFSVGITYAQTFCLQITEVSNDGTDYVIKLEMQGNEAFNLGSSNLQFSYNNAALGTPTLLSSPLGPDAGYFDPTVTLPSPGEVSFNIELGFPNTGMAIDASPGYFELGTLTFPISLASSIGEMVWAYNGGTTETVVFDEDEATQLFVTDPACLVGLTANAATPDCATLVTPADGAIDQVTEGLNFEWTLSGAGSSETGVRFYVSANEDLSEPFTVDLGPGSTSQGINGFDFSTTYYWSARPFNDEGEATGCDIFSIITQDAPPPADNTICADATIITEGTHTEAGPSAGNGATNADCDDDANTQASTNSGWYSYTPTESGVATATSVDLTDVDTHVNVFTGPCDDLSCLGGNDELVAGELPFQSILEFPVVAGETYLIEWSDRWSPNGFDWNLSLEPTVVGDMDMDGVDDADDNCPNAANPGQADLDGDGLGDVCDSDADGDGIDNATDCDDFDANNTDQPGDVCDDGDDDTENDIILLDCTCAGTLPVPTNDLCSGADVIECGETTTGSTATASTDVDIEGCGTSVNTAPGVWYTIIGTGLEITVNTNGSTYDTKLGVYGGSCDALECIETDDDDGNGTQSLIIFDSEAGATYYVYVTGFSANAGDYVLNVACLTDAEGCTDATACNYNSEAGVDDDSCVFAEGCDTCSGETDGSGTVVDNPEIGDDCDDDDDSTENDMYTSCDVCEGTLIGQVDGCTNVDACNFDPLANSDDGSCGFAGDTCDDGEPDTVNDTYGDDCVCSGVEAPANDLCSGAESIACNASTAGSTSSASTDADIEGCGTSVNTSQGVWYSIIGTGDEMNINTNGSAYDTKLGVYGGTCDALECIETDDDDGNGTQSLIIFDSEAGTTYYVYVTGFGSASGDYVLNVICPVSVPGCTDANACNFDADATEDDGSCVLAAGCDVCDGAGGVMDNPEIGDACDDDDANTINDVYTSCGVCEGTVIDVIEGCTDAAACNFDSNANTNDGSCLIVGDGCDDGDATTNMDVVLADCTCVGSAIADCELDSDNDGITDVDEGACPPYVATGNTLAFENGSSGTITNGVASADYSFVNDGIVGYKGVSYLGTSDGIELFHQKDTVVNPDSYAHTLNLTNITPGYVAVIRVCPVAFNMDMPGSNAASSRTFSWIGGSGDASYADPATPSASLYRWPVPGGFDLDEREIIGLPTSGTISNGGGFDTYSTNNVDTEWYVDIPAGATSVSLTSASFNGGTGTNSGMDIKWPAAGWTNGAPGESTREWIAFKIDLVEECTPLDSDGDMIPDYLDLDSDNDGCPDAIEAPGTFTSADVDANGALLCAEDACGIPACAGPAGQGNNLDVVTPGPDSDGDGISDACDTAPDNDDLCMAEPLVATACDNSPMYTGDNTGANPDGTAGACWFNGDGVQNNVWYSVEVPACGSLDIETHDDGGNDDTQLVAYTSDDNTCNGALTDIGCDDDSGVALMSLINLTGLTPGDIVFFQVDGFDGAQGTFGISVSYGSTPDNDEPAGAIAITMDNYWGVPGWDTFDISCATETMAGCDGEPVAIDTWYSFVAQAENTGILAQPNNANPNAAAMDMVIQLFDAAMNPLAGTTGADECEVSRSCFNNYGNGMIERAVPTGLVIGDTYFYRVYDANGTTGNACDENLIDTKVKTYVPHDIVDGCVPEVINNSHSWTVDDPNSMYNIPPVPVVQVRLVMKDALGNMVAQTPAQDPQLPGGLTFELSDFVPIVPNGDYEICAQHKIKMQSNGCIETYWSQSGPSCPTTINLFGDVVTTLSDPDCGITGLNMNSIIKAKPILGATQYRYNFENAAFPDNSFSFDHPTNNLLLAAATVVDGGVLQGMYYGQTYNVTIQAFFNGGFNLEGPTCTITFGSVPPTPSIEGCGTTILRSSKILGIGMNYQFGFYATGNAPPNAPDYLVSSFSRLLVLNDIFINSLPFAEGETYEIYTRVYDQYIDPILPTVQFYSDWSANSCSFTMPAPGVQDNGDVVTNDSELNLKFNVYPNPNNGEQVYLALQEMTNVNQAILVEVFDMFGKKVHSEQIASSGNELNKVLTFDQQLSSGLYLINLSVGGNMVTEKLIVE